MRTFARTVYKNKLKNHLNVRPETLKFLEENIGRTLFDMSHSNIFLDLCPMAKEIKPNINQ